MKYSLVDSGFDADSKSVISFSLNNNFKNKNLLNTSQKDTKSYLENSVLEVCQVASIRCVWQIYAFVAFEKYYQLEYKDSVQ